MPCGLQTFCILFPEVFLSALISFSPTIVSVHFCSVYVACDDILMYLLRITLIFKDFHVISYSSFVYVLGGYPNLPSVSQCY